MGKGVDTVSHCIAFALTFLNMLLLLAILLFLLPCELLSRKLLLRCEGLLLGMNPVCILSDELEGYSHIFGSHDSGLVLNTAHEGRSGGSLGSIGAYLNCISLVISVPKCSACPGAENGQDHESAPFPYKYVDRDCNTNHRKDLGHGSHGKEAEASIAANQVRDLPPVDVAVDRVPM